MIKWITGQPYEEKQEKSAFFKSRKVKATRKHYRGQGSWTLYNDGKDGQEKQKANEMLLYFN